MRNHYLPLTLPLLALALPAAAQHTELIGRAGLGLFRFGGPDAQATSAVNIYEDRGQRVGYTNNPYGSGVGAGFALGARAQHVGARAGLVALDLGYDGVQSRVKVKEANYYDGTSASTRSATGGTGLHLQTLTAFLGVGRRFEVAAVALDVLAGPELAYGARTREKGHGTFDGGPTWTTETGRGAAGTDARLRAETTIWYQRLGLAASYSYGFLNYQRGLVGASPEVYSRTLRLGLAYRLR